MTTLFINPLRRHSFEWNSLFPSSRKLSLCLHLDLNRFFFVHSL